MYSKPDGPQKHDIAPLDHVMVCRVKMAVCEGNPSFRLGLPVIFENRGKERRSPGSGGNWRGLSANMEGGCVHGQ